MALYVAKEEIEHYCPKCGKITKHKHVGTVYDKEEYACTICWNTIKLPFEEVKREAVTGIERLTAKIEAKIREEWRRLPLTEKAWAVLKAHGSPFDVKQRIISKLVEYLDISEAEAEKCFEELRNSGRIRYIGGGLYEVKIYAPKK
jgi:predicted RNA-binding Zn-ribbon protein involved in translation (DUF1610 family)